MTNQLFLIQTVDGSTLGIGTTTEIDQLIADKVIPADIIRNPKILEFLAA